MAADLKASFTLTLEDKLSAGIVALMRKLERLAELAKRVSMSGLVGAEGAIRRVADASDGLSRRLDRATEAARRTAAAVRSISVGTISVNSAGVAALPRQLAALGRAGALSVPLMLAPPGVPPAGVPPRPGASPAGAPLMLGAPGAGRGIPLAPLGLFQSPWSAMTRQAGAFRGQVAGSVAQVQHLNHGMRELAEGGMAAFATGFGLGEPLREYARYENIARHIAITAGVPAERVGAEAGALMAQYNKLAIASGQSAEKVAEAANFLITTGIGRPAVDRMLPLVARAATAYNTQIGDSVQAVFSLKENLHVPDSELAGTISAMALAGKEGHFSFANFSQFLPNLAPAAATSGFKGADGARKLMAMLETSRRNAGTPGEAETNLRDFLGNIFSPAADKHFKELGVNLPALRLDAERKGINPAEAVISKVLQIVQGKTDAEATAIIAKMFHNQQARQFLVGMRADLHYYQELLAKLREADSTTIDQDFNKAEGAPEVKLRQLQEKLLQVVRRFGEGFAGVLDPMNLVLDKMLAGMAWMDQNMPGTLNHILSWVGGFAALAAVLGIMVPLAKLLFLGLRVMFAPVQLLTGGIRLLATALVWLAGIVAGALGVSLGAGLAIVLAIIAAIAGAAYVIYQNWDTVGPWFAQMWANVRDIFVGFWRFLTGVFKGDLTSAKDGLTMLWNGYVGFYKTLWDGVQGTFTSFITWINQWTGGAVTTAIEGIKKAWQEMTGFFTKLVAEWSAPFEAFFARIQAIIAQLRDSPIGKLVGLESSAVAGGVATGQAMLGPDGRNQGGEGGGNRYFNAPTPGAIQPLSGEIIVSARGNAMVERATSGTPGVRLTPVPDRGDMIGRD